MHHQSTMDSRGMYPLKEALPVLKITKEVFIPAALLHMLSVLVIQFTLGSNHSLGYSLVIVALSLLLPSMFFLLKHISFIREQGVKFFHQYELGRRALFALIISWGAGLTFVYYAVFAWHLLSFWLAQILLVIFLLIGNIFLIVLDYELASYFFFGAMTYVVSVVSFSATRFGTRDLFQADANGSWLLAFTVSFIAAVLFAYITNRLFVFSQKGNFFSDLVKFFIARIGSSLIIEVLGMFIAIDLLHLDEDLSRSISAILVTIANYFLSKYFVFRKDPSKEGR